MSAQPPAGERALLAKRPLLQAYSGFLREEDRAPLLAWAQRFLAEEGEENDLHGAMVELPVHQCPGLEDLNQRVEALVGFPNAVRGTVRFRRYGPGQGHPPHLDDYEINGAQLSLTAALIIEEPETGGATEFPDARPWPAAVLPRVGQLVVWNNLDALGAPEPCSIHQGAPVIAGHKGVLLWFFYTNTPTWQEHNQLAEAEPQKPEPPLPGTVFTCVDDGVPEETVRLLREACAKRNVLFRYIDAKGFRYAPEDQLPPRSMLYRPAVSTAAIHVEEFLLQPGVISFHESPQDALFGCTSPQRVMERAGVNVPRTFPVATADPRRLADFVERLGGYPVVLKSGGGEGGVGVLRADNEPSLRGIVDYLVRGLGKVPTLSAYIPGALHFRVIVVGEKAVACYENPIREGDFRSTPSDDPGAYLTEVPEALAAPAILATRAQRLRFGGVDLLRHPSGRVYILEVNFPCYFPQATLGGNLDVAGAMLDTLIAWAREA